MIRALTSETVFKFYQLMEARQKPLMPRTFLPGTEISGFL